MDSPLGRIDVHAHLLPGIDDGCQSYEQSLACARMLVEAGYTHAFCTPHVWPSLPRNTVITIVEEVGKLQGELDENRIDLRVLPGGEINLIWGWPGLLGADLGNVVTYGMEGSFALFDFWAETREEFIGKLSDAIRYLKSLGLTLILAHPERVGPLQREPEAVEWFLEREVRLQMNTWCLTVVPTSPVYRLAERLLTRGKYFLLGTDCHDAESMISRIDGLRVAEKLVGREAVDQLTRVNPRMLSATLAQEVNVD